MSIIIKGFSSTGGGAPSFRLSNGSYRFAISPSGTVTKNSTHGSSTASILGNMSPIYGGYLDDGSQSVGTLPFTVTFLGNTYGDLYIDSNAGLSFGSASSSIIYNANDTGIPMIVLNSNDASMHELYVETTGTTPNQIFTVKYLGNTTWNAPNHPNNYEIDIRFFEDAPGYVDVIVSQEPTSWGDYTQQTPGQVTWGITDGTNWVDGLGTHQSSIGAA